jgi:glycosyltransferase involved in cell wall biosynthesis
MYEYIYSGKPVISVNYEEMSLFKEFVYLYEYGDTGSLINIFNALENNNYTAKKNQDECRYFASQNTWEKRAEELDKYLKEI